MATDEPTPDLTGKLKHLVDSTAGQRQSRLNCKKWPKPNVLVDKREITSLSDLAKVIDVARSQLYPKSSKLNGDIEFHIRAIYAIPESHQCWLMFLDGSFDQFQTDYEKLHGDPTRPMPPPESPALLAPTFPLRLVADGVSPPPLIESLGAIREIYATQQFLEGRDGTISATVICRATNLEDVRIAVRFCKLRLIRLPMPDAVRKPTALEPFADVMNDQKVPVSVERVGSGQRPTVEIKAREGAIELAGLPDQLFDVIEAKEGDAFEVQLLVYLRDCTVLSADDDARPIGNATRPDDGNSFLRPGFDKLGKALALIQARYELLRLSDGETDWALLHTFKAKLVRLNPETKPAVSHGKA
jgi:hypothetical protein